MLSTKLVCTLAVGGAFLVTAQEAAAVPKTYTVTTTDSSGSGSLRNRINAANANPGQDTIEFDIAGADPAVPQVITPVTALPSITDPVIVDGYTQGDAAKADVDTAAALRVVIDASNVASCGVDLAANNSKIYGLVINRAGVAAGAAADGLCVTGDRNVIAGNYLGTDATGSTALGNAAEGLQIAGDENAVGSRAPEDRNVVSANGNIGVALTGADNTVQGNLVGTDPTTTVDLGNVTGVWVAGDNNHIGGAAGGNVISGNGTGVQLELGAWNTVRGNKIGTNADGDAALPNGVGVSVPSDINTIGGLGEGDGNVVSGNDDDGILIEGVVNDLAQGNLVQGNKIGTNAAGDEALPNDGNGVVLNRAQNNVVGGTQAGAGNVIAGNDENGIDIGYADFNGVTGNAIGTDESGTLDLGNGYSGVFILAGSRNTVGNTNPAVTMNTIAFNGADGVRVIDGQDNGVVRNEIFGNELGINLDIDQVTPNDGAPDADSGPNGLQNFPRISSATNAFGVTTASWSLHTLPATDYRIEFYANAACDPSGNGEGETFLDFVDVTTNANGNVSGNLVLLADAGGQVVATATVRGVGGLPLASSEYSPCEEVV